MDHGAQFFTARDPLFLSQVQNWISKGVCFEWTNGFHTWDGSSLRPSEKEWEAPRYACTQGMKALGHDLGAGLMVTRNYRVTSMVQNRGVWTLYPEDPVSGEPIRARVVFSSIPLSQSLELVGAHLAAEELNLLQPLQYGMCFAVMALFERTQIMPEWKGIQIRDPHSSLSWMALDSSKRNAGDLPLSLVLHGSPDFSVQITSEAQKATALRKMMSDAALIAGDWVAEPSAVTSHLWRYAIPIGDGLDEGFLCSTGSKGLYLVGDGLTGGRIERAWLSGFRAASHHLQSAGAT